MCRNIFLTTEEDAAIQDAVARAGYDHHLMVIGLVVQGEPRVDNRLRYSGEFSLSYDGRSRNYLVSIEGSDHVSAILNDIVSGFFDPASEIN